MTGLERNGDVVQMASYAPLMAHADAWQWKPDAIWFDNLRSYGTPDYYVQRVYASNAGTRVVPVTPQAEGGPVHERDLDERSQRTDRQSYQLHGVVSAGRNTACRPGPFADGEGHDSGECRPQRRKQFRAS